MSENKNYLIVYNPCSGQKGITALNKLINKLEGKNFKYVVYHTEKDTIATERNIKNKIKNHSDVVVVGGDGTLNILSNVLAYSPIPLGIIPCGTGNDFSRNIYTKIDDVIDIVTSEYSVKVDLGWCNDRYFMNVLGIGYDAIVAEEVKNNNSKKLRFLVYIWAALKHLPFYRDKELDIKSDDFNKSGKTFMVVFGNGQFFGNGMKITPRATIEDGVLDCCWVGQLGFLNKLQCFAKLFSGKHLSDNNIEYSQGNIFHVLSEGHPIEADGEFFGYTPAHIQVKEKALNLKMPQ